MPPAPPRSLARTLDRPEPPWSLTMDPDLLLPAALSLQLPHGPLQRPQTCHTCLPESLNPLILPGFILLLPGLFGWVWLGFPPSLSCLWSVPFSILCYMLMLPVLFCVVLFLSRVLYLVVCSPSFCHFSLIYSRFGDRVILRSCTHLK